MNSAIKKDSKTFLVVAFASLMSIVFLTALKFAAVNLGLSASTATLVYTALNAIAWGATAAAIVSSFGLGAFGAQIIWSFIKKHTIKQFIKY